MEGEEHMGDTNQQKSIKFRLAITGITIEIIGYQSEELETVTKVLPSKVLWFFVLIIGAYMLSIVPELIKSLTELW